MREDSHRPERAQILAALQALPEADRTAVVLACYERLTCQRIANHTATDPAQIRERLHTGVHALQASLGRSSQRQFDGAGTPRKRSST